MKKTLLGLLSLCSAGLFAQNSYDLVYTTLNTKCSNGSCHSATSSGSSLQFDGSSTTVYNALVNVVPQNTAAAARKDKYLRMNQPYESYLLRKCGGWFDTDLALEANEGNPMQDINGNNLSDKEIEYIRQWVMNGAKKTGVTIDTARINAYYNDPNKTPFLNKPFKPAGVKRLRFGPVFLPPAGSANTEMEYLLKYKVDFDDNVEVSQIDGFMNSESHHLLLFKYQDSASAASMPEGLRIVSLTGGTTSFDGNKDLTGAWQDDAEIHLPAGTAIFWDKNTVLDFNYHLKNYNNPGVLPCDFYLNIAYKPRPVNTSTIEMKSALINNATLFLLPGQQTKYYNDNSNGKNETRHIWMMSSHTHKFGTYFDIHKKDNAKPNQLGDTLYKGNIDYTSNFDKGFYDWEHPSIKYFVPQVPVNMKTEGIRIVTKWNITQAAPVTFGFTTADEMQLFYYMYTNELANPTGVSTIKDEQSIDLLVYPNPTSSKATIAINTVEVDELTITLTDIQGKVITTLHPTVNKGLNEVELNTSALNLNAGLYLVKATGQHFNKESKLIIE